ncbi:hypothetical protein [Reichenbachiella sp.]|uniref:hypothetical protein n=1 Tax=Reichenbachiella sp. TaxID=2184521 RepID=UPI003B59B051
MKVNLNPICIAVFLCIVSISCEEKSSEVCRNLTIRAKVILEAPDIPNRYSFTFEEGDSMEVTSQEFEQHSLGDTYCASIE